MSHPLLPLLPRNRVKAHREWLVVAGGLLLGVVLLTACAANSAALVTPTAALPPTATPDQSAYWQAWQTSPHAKTYDLSKGPNTYCARCHSPQNWDPAAKVDRPPNCVSCKFQFESEPRIAAGNPLVAEADWKDINCEICHVVEDGIAIAAVSWLDPVTGYHETVASSTALCEKCHTNTETLRHQRDIGASTHVGYDCVECHDPHSTTASCTEAGCHADLLSAAPSIVGHDEAHATITCVACHDAAGLQVGPLEGEDVWVVFRTTLLLGRENTEPFQSHNLQRAVACQRCHFVGNPWGLVENVEIDQ